MRLRVESGRRTQKECQVPAPWQRHASQVPDVWSLVSPGVLAGQPAIASVRGIQISETQVMTAHARAPSVTCHTSPGGENVGLLGSLLEADRKKGQGMHGRTHR